MLLLVSSTVLLAALGGFAWVLWPRIQLQLKLWSVKRLTWSYENWDKYQESPRNFAALDNKGNVLFLCPTSYSSWWEVSSRHQVPQWLTESLRALVEREQRLRPDPAFPQTILDTVLKEL